MRREYHRLLIRRADPVQAGDDEHRDKFIDVVLPALVDEGLQVIVTTHDSHMRTLLSNVHQIDGFTVTLDEPEKGDRRHQGHRHGRGADG